jgi:hypothetical protein
VSPAERYVLLGLAPARAGWFRDVAQWASSAAIAAEFIKCIGPDEVRARLASGRAHSAFIVDAELPALDRDLVALAAAHSVPVVAVAEAQRRSWSARDLGVVAVLHPRFGPEELLAVLESHTQMISRADRLPPLLGPPQPAAWRGRLVVIMGSGGTGASSVAIGLAQGLAADPRYGRRVLLADLALVGDQAILHDAGDLGPGLQEVVEAHRLGRPTATALQDATFEVPARGYRLLLGLRRPSAWAALRPRAIDAALEGLRAAFQITVADVTGDLEGEADSGSIEVEERNHLARTTAINADAVFLVGTPGMKGVHSLARLARHVMEAGVAPSRVLLVLTRAPRNPRARAEISRALADLLADAAALPSPVPLPERKVDEALRNGAPLPGAVVDPLTGALRVLLERHADAPPNPGVQPTPIAPGSLGRWDDPEDTAAG